MQIASLSSMPGPGAGVSFCRAEAPTQERKHEKHSIRAWATRQVVIGCRHGCLQPRTHHSLQAARRHGEEHAAGACTPCVCFDRFNRDSTVLLPYCYRVSTAFLPHFYSVSTAFLPFSYLAQSFYRYKKLHVRLCVPAVGCGCGTLTG